MSIGLRRVVMTPTGIDVIIKAHRHMPLFVLIQVALVTVILIEMDIGAGSDSGIYKRQLITINFPGKGDVADKQQKYQKGDTVIYKRKSVYSENST